MKMGGNEMPMPPAEKEQLMAEFYRNHTYLALNRDELDVEYVGTSEMDGRSYEHIRINNEITLNLYLDPETSLPGITTYRQFDPQQGERVTVRIVSEDWQESDGVVIPYKTTVYSEGTQRSVTDVKSHSVN